MIICSNAKSQISLPHVLSDNMVLQQHSQVNLWGTSTHNQKIEINSTWGEKAIATADKNGQWQTKIQTPYGSFTPQELTFTEGENSIKIENILIGEVWFASGQSNMEMPLNGFIGCPVMDANITIATSGQYKNSVRIATVEKTQSYTPTEDVKVSWKQCDPYNSAWFSAVAYHFATLLTHTLNVPVGILNCSWGGSKVESWLPEKTLKKYPDVKLSEKDIENTLEYLRPMVMYNAMLHPIKNYTTCGFIWYQGESNVGMHTTYADRLAKMVELWRTYQENDHLPFYQVEIAPYSYADVNGLAGAYLREAQHKAHTQIPNSGIVGTNDLVEAYEVENIHPKNKTAVGERLAFLALNKTYGYQAIGCEGPTFRSMSKKDDKLIISFANAEDGFSREKDITGFEIAGTDGVFHPAEAYVHTENQTIILSSKQVTSPKYARYCFRNFLLGNISGSRFLPIVPFRTDNF